MSRGRRRLAARRSRTPCPLRLELRRPWCCFSRRCGSRNHFASSCSRWTFGSLRECRLGVGPRGHRPSRSSAKKRHSLGWCTPQLWLEGENATLDRKKPIVICSSAWAGPENPEASRSRASESAVASECRSATAQPDGQQPDRENVAGQNILLSDCDSEVTIASERLGPRGTLGQTPRSRRKLREL